MRDELANRWDSTASRLADAGSLGSATVIRSTTTALSTKMPPESRIGRDSNVPRSKLRIRPLTSANTAAVAGRLKGRPRLDDLTPSSNWGGAVATTHTAPPVRIASIEVCVGRPNWVHGRIKHQIAVALDN